MDGHQPMGFRLDFAKRSKKKITLIVLSNIVVVTGIILVLMAVKTDEPKFMTRQVTTVISTYEQCVDAGYPVQESFPPRCSVPQGATFTKAVEQPQPPTANTTPPAPAAEQTKFETTVGKFALALPGKYIIVKQLDGPFEGGPATRILIGTSAGTHIVDSPLQQDIALFALPSQSVGATQLEQFITSMLEEKGVSGTETAAQTIDTVKAETYILSGLTGELCLFWAKNTTFYSLCGPLEGSSPSQKLKDVITGFKHR